MSERERKPSRIHPEMLVGISAVVIGVCALGVSLYETKLMREEQRAAVIPLIELSRSYSLGSSQPGKEQGRLLIQAENVGIGPARVMDFRVTVDGIAHPTWSSAMQAMLRDERVVIYRQSIINGRTIPPERSVTMFNLRTTELTEDIIKEFDRLDFTACFCSVFNECWTTSYTTFGAAQSVAACQRDEQSFQE